MSVRLRLPHRDGADRLGQGARFDDFSRALALGLSRRHLLRNLIAAATAVVAGRLLGPTIPKAWAEDRCYLSDPSLCKVEAVKAVSKEFQDCLQSAAFLGAANVLWCSRFAEATLATETNRCVVLPPCPAGSTCTAPQGTPRAVVGVCCSSTLPVACPGRSKPFCTSEGQICCGDNSYDPGWSCCGNADRGCNSPVGEYCCNNDHCCSGDKICCGFLVGGCCDRSIGEHCCYNNHCCSKDWTCCGEACCSPGYHCGTDNHCHVN
jgi:hypothetical protein